MRFERSKMIVVLLAFTFAIAIVVVLTRAGGPHAEREAMQPPNEGDVSDAVLVRFEMTQWLLRQGRASARLGRAREVRQMAAYADFFGGAQAVDGLRAVIAEQCRRTVALLTAQMEDAVASGDLVAAKRDEPSRALICADAPGETR